MHLSQFPCPFVFPPASSGVRSVITRQNEVILKAVYPHADSELRNTLSEQLVALLNSYLSGYVAQLSSVNRAAESDRYSALEMEYTHRRSELLLPLCELPQQAVSNRPGSFRLGLTGLSVDLVISQSLETYAFCQPKFSVETLKVCISPTLVSRTFGLILYSLFLC